MPYRQWRKISATEVREGVAPFIELYAPEGTGRRKILIKHYWCTPTSQIDKELGLKPGTAREEIVLFWKWLHKRPKYFDAIAPK